MVRVDKDVPPVWQPERCICNRCSAVCRQYTVRLLTHACMHAWDQKAAHQPWPSCYACSSRSARYSQLCSVCTVQPKHDSQSRRLCTSIESLQLCILTRQHLDSLLPGPPHPPHPLQPCPSPLARLPKGCHSMDASHLYSNNSLYHCCTRQQQQLISPASPCA